VRWVHARRLSAGSPGAASAVASERAWARGATGLYCWPVASRARNHHPCITSWDLRAATPGATAIGR
jgi:hypothetical protein